MSSRAKLQDFDFGMLKPIKKDAIPPVSKDGKIAKLTIYKKFLEVIEFTAKHGATPFEEALEIDLTEPTVKDEAKKLGITKVGASFLARVRKELKSHGIKNIDIVQRDRGQKLFLVGGE